MKQLKKWLSILMVMALMISSMSYDAFAAEVYRVWIGDVKVTSDNASNVLGDGKISYNPATSTLTLNNANITGKPAYDNYPATGIFAGGDINIELVGNNTITIPANSAINHTGIEARSGSDYYNITIKGSGNLTINSEKTIHQIGSSEGIEGKNITIDGTGNILINAGESYTSFGIRANDGDVIIKNSNVKVTTSESYDGSYGIYLFNIGGTTRNLYIQGNAKVEAESGAIKSTGPADKSKAFQTQNGGAIYLSGNASFIGKGDYQAISDDIQLNISNPKIKASTDINGSNPVNISPSNINSIKTDGLYKYVSIKPGTIVPLPQEYNVVVSTEGNGTASANLASGVTGTEVTLSATPNLHYLFKEWQVVSGGVTITNNKFTIGNRNVEVKAVFEREERKITLSHTAEINLLPEVEGYTDTYGESITVTNDGNVATRELNITLEGENPEAFEVSRTTFPSIQPGEQKYFAVNGALGLTAGTYKARMKVSDGIVTKTVPVKFVVKPANPIITLSHTEEVELLTKEVGYTQVKSETIAMKNIGNAPTGDLSVTLEGANPEAFVLSENTIGSLNVQRVKSFTVRPEFGLTTGTYTATIKISNAKITKTLPVKFVVTGATPGIDVSQSWRIPLEFDDQPVGYTTQQEETITITNTKNVPTGDLQIVNDGANPEAFIISKTSIPSIAVGGTDTFTIKPALGLPEGRYHTIINVTNSSIPDVRNYFSVRFFVTAGGGVTTPEITLSQTSELEFVGVEGYSPIAPEQIRINNIATIETGDLNITLEDTNADKFELSTNTVSSIAVGGHEDFTINPKTGITAGTYYATVKVSNADVEKTFPVKFEVMPNTAILSPAITLSQTGELVFTSEEEGYGSVAPRIIIIESTGTAPTGDLTIILEGADTDKFEVDTNTITSIAIGDTETFTVKPKDNLTEGTYTATVKVSNADVEKTFPVKFTVTANSGGGTTTGEIALSHTSEIEFVTQQEGYTVVPAQSIMITNTSATENTGDLNITLEGTDADKFEVNPTTITDIAVGGNDNFTVKPKIGLATGTYRATVKVSNADVTATVPVKFVVTASGGGSTTPGAITGTLQINGTPKFGQMLQAIVMGGTNTGNITFTWERDGATIANTPSYTTVLEDIGKILTVKAISDVETGQLTANTPVIAKQEASPIPSGTITAVPPTTDTNSDAKITGVDDTMQYKKATETTWTAVPAGATEISNLTDGVYEIRKAETATTEAGAIVTITIPAFGTVITPPSTGGGGSYSSVRPAPYGSIAEKPTLKEGEARLKIGSNIAEMMKDGKLVTITMDAAPFIQNGRTMVPLRYVAEILGLKVEWLSETKTAKLTDDKNEILVPINSTKMKVNEQEVQSDVLPILQKGRVYLSISNVGKALGLEQGKNILWDAEAKVVTIIK